MTACSGRLRGGRRMRVASGPRMTDRMDASGFDPKQYGFVFNIQRYTLHDGPGIRTMVFLNGCPLRCPWCCNPESHPLRPTLALKVAQCIGTRECGLCLPVCPPGAIAPTEDGKIRIDREVCDLCLACAAACPSEALHAFGSLWSVDEVMATVEGEGAFYARSGGGMTLSGGEPLLQHQFATSLLREAQRQRIDTALETCGHVAWDVLREAAGYCRTVLFDIKCLDAAKHRQFTGVDNALILSNLRQLVAVFPRLYIVVRTPLIPGFNDSTDDIGEIIEFLKQFPGVNYEVLPYHRLGMPKYGYLGCDYPLKDAALNPETEKTIKALVKAYAASR